MSHFTVDDAKAYMKEYLTKDGQGFSELLSADFVRTAAGRPETCGGCTLGDGQDCAPPTHYADEFLLVCVKRGADTQSNDDDSLPGNCDCMRYSFLSMGWAEGGCSNSFGDYSKVFHIKYNFDNAGSLRHSFHTFREMLAFINNCPKERRRAPSSPADNTCGGLIRSHSTKDNAIAYAIAYMKKYLANDGQGFTELRSVDYIRTVRVNPGSCGGCPLGEGKDCSPLTHYHDEYLVVCQKRCNHQRKQQGNSTVYTSTYVRYSFLAVGRAQGSCPGLCPDEYEIHHFRYYDEYFYSDYASYEELLADMRKIFK